MGPNVPVNTTPRRILPRDPIRERRAEGWRMGEPDAGGAAVAAVLDRLTTTGCVVTTAYGGRRDGCFVGFITACSLEPPRLLVCTSHQNLTHELVEQSGVLAIHPVAQGQEAWVARFGMQSGRATDKFATLAWRPGATGAPVLADALGYLEGRVLASLDCGDHTARLVAPVTAGLRDRGRVLLSRPESTAQSVPVDDVVVPARAASPSPRVAATPASQCPRVGVPVR